MRQKRSRRGGNPAHSVGGSGFNSAPGALAGTILQSGFSIKSKPLFGYHARRNIQYYSSGSVSSGASSAGSYVFSANGAFDPDITGTGGQPMGFDQMMIFFNHYTVLSSRIRVVFQSGSTSLRVTCGLSVSGSSSAVTSIENLVENGDITFQVLEYAGAMGGTATLRRRLNVGKFQDVPEPMDDPNMRGDVASNPTEQAYYHLSCWNSASATVVTCDFQVLIEYDTVFHEPRKASLSLVELAHEREELRAQYRSARLGLGSLSLQADDSKLPGYGGTSDPTLALLGDNVLQEVCPPAPIGLKRPIVSPPRPSVQGSNNLQAGGTALISRRLG